MQLLENLGGQNVFQEWAYIKKKKTSKKSVGDSFRNVCLF
jgi:hypothetical protein